MKNKLLSFVLLFCFPCAGIAQQDDSTKKPYHLTGTVNVTNNGISLVPNFSLNKPAVIINMSAGSNRFSFDPDIRFSLSAKPWTMLFWLRYKAIPTGKFRLTTGAHLGLNYKISTLPVNGDSVETNVVRRYLAAEIVPNYFITNNISVGIYYLYSYGLDPGTVRNTNFIVLNTNFSNIRIANKIYAGIKPQVYYLKQDDRQGWYLNASLSLARKNFPLSAGLILNQRLSGNIAGAKNFLWSVGLIYSFNKTFIEK